MSENERKEFLRKYGVDGFSFNEISNVLDQGISIYILKESKKNTNTINEIVKILDKRECTIEEREKEIKALLKSK